MANDIEDEMPEVKPSDILQSTPENHLRQLRMAMNCSGKQQEKGELAFVAVD